MCGIAGIFHSSERPVSQDELKRMGDAQRHRGPDNFSVFTNKNIGLAHNRLSILDLSEAGNQPYFNDSFALAYNGEIYNYVELRQKIEKEKKVVFKSTSDTAVLFEHLIHYGVDETLKCIQGMFAFSFCDLKKQTVYLCRDRFGIKPLYWISCASGIYWSSEIKALTTVLDIKLDPIKTLFSVAGIGDQLNRRTIFENIENVPPGQYLVVQSKTKPKLVEYYNLSDEVSQEEYQRRSRSSFAQVMEEFEGLLEGSIKRMLMSDAPMGIFVSGGVDSSLIAAKAVEMKTDLSLFTADVIGKYSEYEDAKHLSEFLKYPLHEARYKENQMLSLWPEITYHYECPIIKHVNAIPFSQVAAVANQKGVKAVLTGEGADELFLGYPNLLNQKLMKFLRWPVDLVQFFYGIFPNLKNRLFGDTTSSINDFLALSIQNYERQQFREEGIKAYDFLPPSEKKLQYKTIEMVHEHLISLLHRNDRMGMYASIESRFPFLDESLVRFSVNLPLKWKRSFTWRIHDQKHAFLVDKYIVRQLAKKCLLRRAAVKVKQGFPMHGHKSLAVKKGYFKGGYAAEILGMDQKTEDYLIRTQDPYYVVKLVSLDIFGRIFEGKESLSDIKNRISNYITM